MPIRQNNNHKIYFVTDKGKLIPLKGIKSTSVLKLTLKHRIKLFILKLFNRGV